MNTKNTAPQLFTFVEETNAQLAILVSQTLWIDIVESWDVKYSLQIENNKELKEDLRVNVTFNSQDGGYHSYGTYVSKHKTIEGCIKDLEVFHTGYINRMSKRKIELEQQAKEQKILSLIKEGKVQEAAELSAAK